MTDHYLAAEKIQNQNWQYFIERVIKVCKSKEKIKPNEGFLLTTVENTTIAKEAYETFYNIASTNFNLTINKISVDKQNQIKEDLLSKNFWWEHALTDLDSWIAFYYDFGRFPGSDIFTNVPNVNVPSYLQAEMPLSPLHLFKKFKETDAKGLVSLHGLAAWNIYFGGSQDASQIAMGEYLRNLTYQALSQENDNIFLSFTDGASLIHLILEAFKRKEQKEVEKSKIISEKIKDKLDIKFDVVETPAMKIQLGDEESEIEHQPKSIEFSTPLKIEEIDEIYDQQKSDFLKIAMKLNQIDFESVTEVADSGNEALIQEIINPMPGLIFDDNISANTQFSFQNSDLDTNFV